MSFYLSSGVGKGNFVIRVYPHRILVGHFLAPGDPEFEGVLAGLQVLGVGLHEPVLDVEVGVTNLGVSALQDALADRPVHRTLGVHAVIEDVYCAPDVRSLVDGEFDTILLIVIEVFPFIISEVPTILIGAHIEALDNLPELINPHKEMPVILSVKGACLNSLPFKLSLQVISIPDILVVSEFP